MSIKRTFITYGLLIAAGVILSSYVGNNTFANSQKAYQQPSKVSADNRISLDLPPAFKTRQLTRMRSHLKTTQSLMRLIAEEKFIEASELVKVNFGKPKGNRKMFNQIKNDGFKNMGTAFHQSALALSEALETKDTKKSLLALNATLNQCTQCHAVFRQ